MPLTFEKSGLKRNSTPFIPPGNRHELTTTTNSSTKSVGMKAFDARSMPPRTPRTMMKWQMQSIATVHKTGFTGDAEKSAK